MGDFSRHDGFFRALSDFGLPVAVVDLETTGGNLHTDRITEVAILRADGGNITRYTSLVNPQQNIPEFVRKLTGIDNDTVAGAPLFADLAGELLPLLCGCLLLAHNSKFDYTFLRREFARCGLPFAAPTLCTVQLSRRLYPQFYRHSLDSIIERHNIATASRHRAMDDVLALADFLETAAGEHGAETFADQARGLIRPQLPPAPLAQTLSAQLYALSDCYGALLWLDDNGRPLHLAAHEQTFSEAVGLLHKFPNLRRAAGLHFLPAAGPLHAIMLKANLSDEYAFWPSENTAQEYLTVRLRADECGRLQVRLARLQDGMDNERPHGLFLHKKSAKRALAEWAKKQKLCPALLDILPESYAKNVPCPLAACGSCDGACASSDGLPEHNRRATAAARLLPVCDWGAAHDLEITETDEANGEHFSFSCSGGALAMPDGRWYFDRLLPKVLKEKFKTERHNIRVVG